MNLTYNNPMDMKNAYNSDKEARKEKVVIGLTGGIDSLVSAYLLKIQKYDLYAVTVVNAWESYPGDQSKVLSCHMDEARLTKIKDFCHSLSIPLYVVKSTDEFYQSVVEKWTGSRLSGTKSTACWSCHDLRMKVLFEKKKELGAKFLATGHYAKVFHHESHGTVYVHTSNDEVYDQSALLSRLPHEIMDSLLLPLSDLQRKEVLKLAENFGLTDMPKKIQMHHCFEGNAEVIKHLEPQIAPRFLESGLILSLEATEDLGEHTGILHYQYGEEVPTSRHGSQQFLKRFGIASLNMEVATKESFMKNEVHLVQCHLAEETPWDAPFKGVMKLGDNDFVDCWIHPKSLQSVHVTWEEKRKILEKDIVSVYKKRGKNAKIFLTGKVRYLPEEIQEGDNESEKVDYTSDL